MSAHRKRRRRDADGPTFHPLAFGGWGDYKIWAEHQFLPKPVEDAQDDDDAAVDALVVDAQEQPLDDPPAPLPAPVPEPEPSRPLARPYVLAGGRTQDDDPLRLDSLISVTPEGVALTTHSHTLSEEYRQVFDLCRRPTAVVEIAARLRMPIGVALVLISKAIGWNLLTVLPPAEVDGQPSLELIVRVHEGLRRLC